MTTPANSCNVPVKPVTIGLMKCVNSYRLFSPLTQLITDTFRQMLLRAYRTTPILLLLILSGSAWSQGIDFKNISSTMVGGVYLLDARIKYDFNDEVLEALEHGVSLRIDIIIRIKKKRKWLWDKKIREDVINFKLERHPLSNHYLVSNLKSRNRYQLQSLDDALTVMGTIKNYKLVEARDLDQNASYTGDIMAKLNIESLPPPLRPVAYASEHWQLKSPWQKWVIR